ncbi:helix-turn-helix domain-containing protein [Streptomyces caelestis]|uniref:helix-turn-helix domain-containing protein n=1 Tax=Streptomyces caelestis TaxID=36816 RepID=UPI0036F84DD3
MVLVRHPHLTAEFPRRLPGPRGVAQQLAARQDRSASPLARIFSACSTSVINPTAATGSLVSGLPTHHFRVLRESGVIRQVYRGTVKMNGLRRDDLDELFPGLLDALLDAAGRQAGRS